MRYSVVLVQLQGAFCTANGRTEGSTFVVSFLPRFFVADFMDFLFVAIFILHRETERPARHTDARL
jgi:hypothetical protein